MELQFLPEKIPYTGHELSPHWISQRTGIYEDSIVAFQGPCRVNTSELVDLEDRVASRFIASSEMLHFIGENFHSDLDRTIVEHRLLIALFAEELRSRLSPTEAARIERQNNDLFVRDGGILRKLSVGIVTASPVSTLFHFGVNVDESGAPVAAFGLRHFAIDVPSFANSFLERWRDELASLRKARCKVAPRS